MLEAAKNAEKRRLVIIVCSVSSVGKRAIFVIDAKCRVPHLGMGRG